MVVAAAEDAPEEAVDAEAVPTEISANSAAPEVNLAGAVVLMAVLLLLPTEVEVATFLAHHLAKVMVALQLLPTVAVVVATEVEEDLTETHPAVVVPASPGGNVPSTDVYLFLSDSYIRLGTKASHSIDGLRIC